MKHFRFILPLLLVLGVSPLWSQSDSWEEHFHKAGKLSSNWVTKGAASFDKTQGFRDNGSLMLEKNDRTLRDEVSATSRAIPATGGTWTVGYAVKSELQSMDNSYQGDLSLELLDEDGHVLERIPLINLYNRNPWKPELKEVELDARTASVRFAASIRKETPGRFWVDDLTLAPSQNASKRSPVKRISFAAERLGNLLYPADPRIIHVEVWSDEPLAEADRRIALTVKDYWGAEQGEWTEWPLTALPGQGAPYRYRADFDMAAYPLEVGRYYEVYGTVTPDDNLPYTDNSSFAILPEAEANSYPAQDIPWTSRNWDNRIPEYIRLTHRLGIRICGLWGHMDADYDRTDAPGIGLVEELGMGYLTGSPAHSVEQRVEGWQELLANDGEKIRQGVRNFIKKYNHIRPMIINLGNEPHAKGEEAKANVEAYRIVYDEVKRIDPSIYVVGTSVGISEDFARYGYGKWCDAYDFHVYESAESVREIVSKRYPDLFRKYGEEKPIWSTELGLNSQGMARISVASELYRKSVNFFAGGGASMSWFGLLYPDPEGKSRDSFGSAHNVFYCQYNCYAPKMDAIAYYNMVNSLGIKKYVDDRLYDGNTRAFLFTDREGRHLQVLYNEKGRRDIFLPLPDVTAVKAIGIDGRIRHFDAAGRGLTLTVSEEPVLLLYTCDHAALPDALPAPEATFVHQPDKMVAGEAETFSVSLHGVHKDGVTLQLPPFWTETARHETTEDGRTVLSFSVKGAEYSTVREADINLLLRDPEGRTTGMLSYRPVIAGALSLQVLPNPHKSGTKATIGVQIRNNSSAEQALTWNVSLYGEQELNKGNFTPQHAPSAYFTATPSGKLTLKGNETKHLTLELGNIDLYKVYRLRATVQDALGRVVTQERPVSSFYGVPKAKKAMKIDGRLNDSDWKRAPIRRLNTPEQFYAFVRREADVQDWTGTDDLSADVRCLWDEDCFYISLDVKDDIAGDILQADDGLWQQDGLQFLIDPVRTLLYKIGKYEYSVGEGIKGVQTWCTLSATGSVSTGNKPEVKVAIHRADDGSGNVTYEIAFPWSSFAPFTPEKGANLGLALIVNEDDGGGRNAYMTWFGDVNSKDVDTVGDLILTE